MSPRSFLDRWFFRFPAFAVISFILSFSTHLPFLNRPPESQHGWRQCSTLAVARNFYQEEMNPFRPRVDQRFQSDGVTGMHFPSYEYVLAGIYHLTGEKYWVHRCYSFLILFLAYSVLSALPLNVSISNIWPLEPFEL